MISIFLFFLNTKHTSSICCLHYATKSNQWWFIKKKKNQINGSTFINTTVFVKLFGLNFLEWSRLWLVEEECYKSKIIHIQTQKKGYTVMDYESNFCRAISHVIIWCFLWIICSLTGRIDIAIPPQQEVLPLIPIPA